MNEIKVAPRRAPPGGIGPTGAEIEAKAGRVVEVLGIGIQVWGSEKGGQGSSDGERRLEESELTLQQ